MLYAGFETHSLNPAVTLVALARRVLVVGESRRHVNRDSAHRINGLLEGIEVDPDEIVDPDTEQVREQRIRDSRARVDRACGLGPLAEHPGGVREVDALLRRLAVAQRDRHVPVARDRDLCDLGLMTLDGEDRYHHDRIAEECTVMAIAAVAEEHDVDSLVSLALLVDRRATSPCERADHGA